MKKSIYILVAFVMVLTGTACGKANSNTDEENQNQNEEEQSDPENPPGDEQTEREIPFLKYSLNGDLSTWPNFYYYPMGGLQWINLGYDEDYNNGHILVIDSDQEMMEYVYGDSYAPVDFTEKTLLLGYGLETSRNPINKVNFKQIAEQKYVMTVDICMGPELSLYDWRVPIIVDKLPEGSEVELVITRECKTEQSEHQPSGEGEQEEPQEPAETDIHFSKYALDGDISTWPNATYGGIVSGSLQWNVGYDYNEEPEIIFLNSDQDMAGYVDGEYTHVDFSTKTLLLAYGCEWTMNPITDVGLKRVSEQEYIMTINFQMSGFDALYYWRVPIVVDKLPEGSKVELEIIRDGNIE